MAKLSKNQVEKNEFIKSVNEERFGLNEAVRMLIAYVTDNNVDMKNICPNWDELRAENKINARFVAEFWSTKDENGTCVQSGYKTIEEVKYKGFRIKVRWSIKDVLTSLGNINKKKFEVKIVDVENWILVEKK